jgi:hypothetical protein
MHARWPMSSARGRGIQVTFVEDLSRDGMKRNSIATQSLRQARSLWCFSAVTPRWPPGELHHSGRQADLARNRCSVFGIGLESILREMNSRGAKVKIAIIDASRQSLERRIRRFS